MVETTEKIVDLTEKATERLTELLKKHPDETAIRLDVEGGGCAGLQYKMAPCNSKEPEDMVSEVSGVHFYVNPKVVSYLQGLTIDFSDDLVDGGFKFINPNASSTCSCGTSFGV